MMLTRETRQAGRFFRCGPKEKAAPDIRRGVDSVLGLGEGSLGGDFGRPLHRGQLRITYVTDMRQRRVGGREAGHDRIHQAQIRRGCANHAGLEN
jgi:hypothetical protein